MKSFVSSRKNYPFCRLFLKDEGFVLSREALQGQSVRHRLVPAPERRTGGTSSAKLGRSTAPGTTSPASKSCCISIALS